jgi:hypothetical protein
MVLHICIYSLSSSKKESGLNEIISKMTINPAVFSLEDPLFPERMRNFAAGRRFAWADHSNTNELSQ